MYVPTRLLYLDDSYLREFDAQVIEVGDNYVVLDATAFHPTGGGVAHDVGTLTIRGRTYAVVDVKKRGEDVLHVLDAVPESGVGDAAHGVIDWDRRYRLMRLHTATHILAAILYRRHGALVTGGDITPEYAKDDFSIEGTMEEVRRAFEDAIEEANEVVRRGIEVRIYYLPRDEALRVPGIVKLASRLPPEVERLRIVEIPGIDVQADGGPHVGNTSEIGSIRMVRIENRGRGRKRLYYTVEP